MPPVEASSGNRNPVEASLGNRNPVSLHNRTAECPLHQMASGNSLVAACRPRHNQTVSGSPAVCRLSRVLYHRHLSPTGLGNLAAYRPSQVPCRRHLSPTGLDNLAGCNHSPVACRHRHNRTAAGSNPAAGCHLRHRVVLDGVGRAQTNGAVKNKSEI